MKLALVAVAVAVALQPRPAAAFSACNGEAGWAPRAGDTLPTHAHLVFWSDRPYPMRAKLVAKIGGVPVKTRLTTMAAAPYTLTLVTIDSDRTGALELGWEGEPPTRYVVATRPSYADPHATTARYHHKLAHSTVQEVFDGLLVTLDVPAVRAHVKLRRDARSDWLELDLPVTGVDGDRTLRIGELGCKSNYTPALLEAGVDLDVTLFLPDDSQVRVKELTHASIPKLAHPTSDDPSVSE